MAARKTRKTRKTTEERKAQTAALRARLEEWQGAEGAENLIAMALATFDGYSDRNAQLIAMQAPTATDVDGFHAWKARGRAVRKGEHGIQILAPAGTRKGDPEAENEEDRKDRQFFRIAYVFDIAQTDELAEVTVTPEGVAA
jgi:antirestriction protein ArdC